jgi:hypothetical protein
MVCGQPISGNTLERFNHVGAAEVLLNSIAGDSRVEVSTIVSMRILRPSKS